MCSTAGCESRALARGLCSAHYHGARREGNLPERIVRGEPLVPHKTWIPEDADSELQRLARATGRSYSDLIREAVVEYLARKKQ